MVPVSTGKKFHSASILQKHYFELLLSKTCKLQFALSLFNDITSLTYFDF